MSAMVELKNILKKIPNVLIRAPPFFGHSCMTMKNNHHDETCSDWNGDPYNRGDI